MEKLHWKSAAELADMYRSLETTPTEVVDAVIKQLELTEPVLNAFVTRTVDRAREEARLATERFAAGEELPTLFGIPITVKDLTDTADIRTTYGASHYSDNIPDEDAISWARLKAQGVILIGKTTTPEFGLLGVTESKLTGTTNNPWDPARVAGGSSGGAAAAVMSGVAPLAWGSDGGGSIRVPSSLCGAVGVKPSIGRIPTAHSGDGDSTEGPITRTVLDAALLMDVTVGPHLLDRFSLPATGECYADIVRAVEASMNGLTIAVAEDLGQKVLHPETRRVFREAIARMASAGADVIDVSIELPDTQEYFNHLNGPEYTSFVNEARANAISDDDIWPMILEFAERGDRTTGVEVSRAFRDLKTEIYDAFIDVLDGADIFITPTTALPAFHHGGDYGPSGLIDGQVVPPWALFLHSMTEPPSHAGVPAVTINGGYTSEGLPVGLQFMARPHDDAGALAAAARWELIAKNDISRRPQIALD